MDNENKKNFDKAKKNNLKKYISWALIAALVLGLAVMPLMAKTEVEEDGPQASILSGTVGTGSVSTGLKGGGTLEAGDAEDVTIPSGVKITEFLVKNGDVVTEGTPLATVDKVSVMTAIVDVTETMEYLQDEMEDVKDDTVSSTISATAGGRVKQIFAEEGDSVQDVMLEHGALAVLSLDGLMAVSIERKMDIGTGDSVCVTFEDDTEVTGRVESTLNGVIVVTVEDEGYDIGEKVTVTTEDGDRVGSGELYVHSAWSVTAFTGTVSKVSAKLEKTVSEGATLFKLEDTEFTAQLEYMASLHREYEELLQDLIRMYEDGVITAPCDGLVSGVDKDSAHLLSSVGEDWELVPLTAQVSDETEETGWKIVLLSNTTTDTKCTCGKGDLITDPAEHDKDTCVMACTKDSSCTAKKHDEYCITLCDKAAVADGCDAKTHYAECIKRCSSASEEGKCTATKYHYSNCIQSCSTSDGTVECTATGAHHADCIKICDKTENCQGGKNHYDECVTLCDRNEACDAVNHYADCPLYGITYTAYAAKVQSAGNEIVANADATTVYTVTSSKDGWKLDKNLSTELMIYETVIKPSNAVTCSNGDIILVMTGKNSAGEVIVQNKVVVYQKAADQTQTPGGNAAGGMTGDMSSILSGMMSGGMMSGSMSGFGSYSGIGGTGSAASSFELFDLDGDVLMTVTDQNAMTLSVTLDEKDISKVSVGQTAEVKVEALKGETFEATVSKVGVTGTNNGGSSKFTVELTMDKAEDMLAGMSATASIPLYTKMDVLTIPVKALAEEGAKTVVYTALNEETGEPASPVEVEIGLSDGENAEVVSGLNSGDTYYYSYYDILELDNSVKSSGGFAFGR